MIHLQQQDVEAVAEEFRQEFADADDLIDLSPAALRLLAHAAALFHASGAVATSVRGITGSCGQTPGALYRHFESKDELLYRLVCHGHERLERRIAGALAGADTPVDRVAAFVRGYVSGHLTSPRLAQVVRREYVHLDDERLAEVVKRRRALRDRLAALLRAGQRAGALDLIPGPDGPTRTAVMVLDLCSRTSDWFDSHRGTPIGPLAERYVQAALRIVGAEGA